MRKIRLLSFVLAICAFGLATNAHADVFCRNSKKYTSCASGYYMTYSGTYNGTPRAGNVCTACPTGCTCPGGTANKSCQTTATITFKTGNTTLGTQTCTIGQSVTLNTLSSMNSNVPSGLKSNGWSFSGWAGTASEDVDYTNGQSISCSADMTLYGVWSRTVTFKYYNSASATSVTTATKTQLYFNNTATTGNVTTMSTYALYTQSTYGWAPQGWRYDDDSGGVVVSQTGTSTTIVAPGMSDPNTVYAVYERTPQIKYNANGGSGSMSNSNCDDQVYIAGVGSVYSTECRLNGNTFTPPSGSAFSGYWAKGSASGTQVAAGDDIIFPNDTWTGSKTYNVYAIWATTSITLTLGKNSGSGTIKNNAGTTYTGTTSGSMTCTPGTTNVALPTWDSAATTNNTTNITRGTGTSAKVFLGWSTSSSCTTSSCASTSITCPSSATTYYAVWGAPTCSVTNGTGTIATSNANRPTCTVSCTAGYGTSGTQYGTAGTLSVSYTCTGNTITLSWNNGGHGTAPTTPSSCTYGGTFTMPAAMTATGYTFNKWVTSGTSTTQFSAGATNVACTSANLGVTSGTATITGSWTANTCTITFKTGNTTLGTQTFTTGDSLNTLSSMNSNVPSALKSNSWSFDGWATTYNTAGIGFSNGDDDAAICSSNGTSRTFYGVWSRSITRRRFSSASTTTVTGSVVGQTYYNTTTSSASPKAINTTALYTNSTYGWAPVGWVNDSSSHDVLVSQTGSSTVSFTPAVDQGATWYAVYTRTPEVVYNANGGSGSMSNSTCNTQYFTADGSGTTPSCTLSDNSFTAPSNKQFSAWAAGSASGTQYAAGANYTCTNTAYNSSKACQTMYAIWSDATATITVTAGNGKSAVSATGWTGTGGTSMTKVYNIGDTITLSTISGTNKTGYTGTAYSVGGSAITGTYTVTGDATITVNATALSDPSPSISGSATKTYSYTATTLTASGGTYDSGVTLNYAFGTSSLITNDGSCPTADSSYTFDTASTTATKSVAKAAYLGKKCYKVKVTATDGTLTSNTVSGPSTPAYVDILKRSVTFDATTNGGTLSGTSPIYASYRVDAKGYTGKYSTTERAVPTATKAGAIFNGWYSSASGGTKVTNASGALTSSNVTGVIYQSKWSLTTTNKTVYAQFTNCTCTPGAHVASCTAGTVSNNTCAYSFTCETGYNYNGSSTGAFSASAPEIASSTSPDCTQTDYAITVTAGRGVSTVAATGWTGTGTATMTKSFNHGSTITLSDISGTLKSGYTGIKYLVNGTEITGTYTVTGAVTITVEATGISAPTSVAITGGTTKTYNQSATTLTGSQATSYDSGITVYYNFGSTATATSSTCSGSYTYGTASSTATTSVAKGAFRGYKCYKVKVYASDGTLTSSTVEASTATTMGLINRTLTFNVSSNGGTIGSGTSPAYTYYQNGSVYTSATGSTAGTIPAATKSGAVFNGWYSEASGGSKVINADGTLTGSAVSGYTDSSKRWVMTGDKTVYAQFTACAACVNGTGAQDCTMTVTNNTCTYAATCKTGYSTSGGSSGTGTTATCSGATCTCQPNVTGAINLDSKWYLCASCTANKVVDTNATPTPVYVKYETGVYSNSGATTAITKLSTNPAWSRATFAGFYTGKKGTGDQMVDASGNFTAAALTQYATAGATGTWYAHWTMNDCQPVTLNAEGAHVEYSTPYPTFPGWTTTTIYYKFSTQKYYSNSTCTTQQSYSTIIPTATGYAFQYWEENSGGSIVLVNSGGYAVMNEDGGVESNENDMILADFSLGGYWTCTTGYDDNNGVCTAQTSTVTLNKNTSSSDTTTVATVTATYDAAMPSKDSSNANLTVPTRTGYTFTGYYDARTGGTQYYTAALASARTWNKTGAQTLYAQWTPNVYTITLNVASNGGSGGSGTVYEKYATGWSLTNFGTTVTSVAIPTKSKSVFLGYYNSASGTTQYVTAAGALPANTTFTADTTIYAKFSACTCGTDTNATCEVMETSNNTCQYKHTCAAGYYNANNGATGTSNTMTCTKCSAGKYCPEGATSESSCPTNWTSDAGASAQTQCYRNITLNKNGGSGTLSAANTTNTIGATTGTNPDTVKCYYNTACAFPSASGLVPTAGGYKMAGGWGTANTCTASTTSFTETSTATTVTYYACKNTCSYTNSVAAVPSSNVCAGTCNTGYSTSGGSNTGTSASCSGTTCTCSARDYTINYTLNGGEIPSGYTPVEYLQSAGTSYIDTGIKAKNTMRAETTYKRTGTANSCVFGNYGDGGTGYNFAFWNNTTSANSYLYDPAGTNVSMGVTLNNTSWHDLVVDLKNAFATVDGTTKTITSTRTFTTSHNIPLFGRYHTSSSYGLYMAGQMKSFKLYDNDVLVRNFVPARRDSDGVCGMYDTVEGVFYAGATPSAFSCPSSAGLPTSYTYAVGATVAGRPIRAHSVFEGWCTDSALTTCATTQTISTTDTGDKTFYAKWTCNTGYTANAAGTACVANTYTVVYNSNKPSAATANITGTTSNSTHTYDTPKNLTTNGYSLTGWTFQGWSTSATSSTVTYTNGQSVNNLTATAGATITLYAVWTQNCNAITLNANDGTAGSVATLYKKTDATGWYSNNTCTTAYSTTTNVKPSRSGYTFRGFYNADLADATGDTTNGTQYITTAGATTTAGTNWTVNAPATIYAAWATNCPSSVAHGSCSLDVSTAGAVDYTTSCDTGYSISGNNTSSPSCAANCNAITLNANEGTAGSVTTLYKKTDATGWYSNNTCTTAWTSGTNVKPTRTNYTFRGFYVSSSNAADVTATQTNGASRHITDAGATTQTGTNWTVNAPTTIYAGWARNCAAGTGANCTLAVGQNTTYTTSCKGGYGTLSNGGQYNPSCTQCSAGTASADGNNTCSTCANWTYSGAGASSCTNCPTLDSGYSKADSTTTGWTTYTKCVEVSNDSPTNCASGNLKKTASASGSTTWGSASVNTALTAKAGYYVSGITCPACSGLASGLYPNSNAGNSGGASVCYTNDLSGKYIATANAGTATNCANWTWKGANTVNYGSTSTCDSCPTLDSGWAKKNSTGTGWTAVTQCVETHTPANCASGTTKKVATNSTTWGSEAFDTTLSSNAGYYAGTSAISCTICPAGSYCPAGATAATACTTGSYTSTTGKSACTACQGGTTTSGTGKTSCDADCANAVDSEEENAIYSWAEATWNSNNTVSDSCKAATCYRDHYIDGNDCERCDSFANGFYPLSPSGTSSGQSACYLRKSDIPGMYIAEAYDTVGTPCAAGTYSDGEAVIHYGETSTCKNCADNTYATVGSAACTPCAQNYTTPNGSAKDSESACRIYCAGGSYIAAARDTTCTDAGAGYWAAAAYVSQGSTGTRTQCASGLTTVGRGTGADEAGDCGHKLHAGNNLIYLRSNKVTTPSLHVKIGGTMFYGNMSTQTIGSMRVKRNGQTYSVYDDITEEEGGASGGGSGITINPSTQATTIVPATYASANGETTWSAVVAEETLTGNAACSTTTASNGDLSTSSFTPENAGTGCWCKLTSPATGTKWIYATANSLCSTKCAFYCANNMKGTNAKNITYRTNLYTSAGIATQ